MKTPLRHRSESAQLIIVAPVLILFALGAVLLTVNIANVVRDRAAFQLATDNASRTTAYCIGMQLEDITLANIAIVLSYSAITQGTGLMADPKTFKQGLKDVKDGCKLLKIATQFQGEVKKWGPVVSEVMGYDAMVTNATFKSVAVSIFDLNSLKEFTPDLLTKVLGDGKGALGYGPRFLSLNVKEWWGIPKTPMVRYTPDGTLPTGSVGEIAITISILFRIGENIPGNSLLKGRGDNLTRPYMWGVCAAKPYCKLFGHNPLSRSLNIWMMYAVMFVPWQSWDAKIVDFESGIKTEIESWIFGAIEKKVGYGLTKEVFGRIGTAITSVMAQVPAETMEIEMTDFGALEADQLEVEGDL